MTDLTQLRTLAEAAQKHLADEYALHGFDNPPRITPGMVRCVQAALADVVAAPPARVTVDRIVTVAGHIEETLTRHHLAAVPAPQEEQPVPATPATPEPPAALNVSAVLERLRQLAVDGVMPTQTVYNAQRGDLLSAASLYTTYKFTWSSLAEAAGLKMAERGRARKQPEPEPPPDPDPAPTFRRRLDEAAPALIQALSDPPPAPTAPAGDSAHLPWSPDKRRAVMADIIAELRMMADGNVMPSEADWNSRKPEALPNARTIRLQWEIAWDELAHWAKLTPAPRKGRPPKRPAIIRTDAHNGATRPTHEVVA